MSIPRDGEREPTLRERVAEVHQLRLAHDAAKAELSLRRRAWEEENRELIDRVALGFIALAQAEAQAKAAAVEIFAACGDRNPAPGLTIIERRQPSYSVLAAIQWAREHNHPELVRETLDKRGFEELAKVLSVPGVHWRVVPHGQLATDLSEAIDTIMEEGQDG